MSCRACLLRLIVAGVMLMVLTSGTAWAQDAAPAPKEMFSELCARCHGPQGLGNGPDGASLGTRPRNFHDCALMAKDSDDLVFREVKGGSAAIGRSNDMPSWGQALEDDQIKGLIAFVRAFCPKK
jgi:mono/diheme cytochrome c family protein